MFFDLLISASTKAIKDFISFIYSKCRVVYCRFKKWLMDFSEYDAFVSTCFEEMFELETFEEEVVATYERLEDELAAAQAKLREVHNPYLWGYITDFIKPARPADVEEAQLQVWTKELQITGFIEATLDEMEETAHENGVPDHELEKAALTPTQLKKRLKKAAKHRRDKLKAKEMISKMDHIERIAELSDWTEFVYPEEIDTKKSRPAQMERSEDGDKYTSQHIAVKFKWERRIKQGCERKARDYIRAYVLSKNARLKAGEVDKLTIQRYVEQFCDANDFVLESKTQLIKVALMMVPIPTTTELDIAMTVHCPKAEALRHKMECIESSVF
ncbi:RNA dependent RNA polymerase P1 [Almond luteovirus 1]|nr:RNA dependent RNA polymerase P1 [Almond luteovirus 1]